MPGLESSMDSQINLPSPSSLIRSPKVMSTSLPPPSGFSDNPEYMQHWLRAKAEDDRRGQEEEKTRQEALKLERRKIEQAILADSLRAGVPPHMLPLLLAGMNDAGAANGQSATAGLLRPAGRPARVAEGPAGGLTPPTFTWMPPSNTPQPPPAPQQTAALRSGPRSPRSSTSISFHHWVPPQAHIQAEGQNSSSRKRKSSYEAREEDYRGPATPVEQLAAAPESCRDQDIKHEEERKSPDREAQDRQLSQALTSENETLSTPSLDAGMSIKSGGTNGLDRP